MGERACRVTSAPVKLAPGRIPQVITDEPRRSFALPERSDARFGALPLRDGDCAIQPIERRWRDAIECRIELRDVRPGGVLVFRSEAVMGGDCGFDVIAREPIATRRTVQI